MGAEGPAGIGAVPTKAAGGVLPAAEGGRLDAGAAELATEGARPAAGGAWPAAGPPKSRGAAATQGALLPGRTGTAACGCAVALGYLAGRKNDDAGGAITGSVESKN